MTQVLLCNSLTRLEVELKNISGPLRYINLTNSAKGLDICRYLNDIPGTLEIPKGQQFRESNTTFAHEYVEFISQLNVNNYALPWWALSFSNKNPMASQLYRDVFYVLLITGLAHADPKPIVVITDNTRVAAQVSQLKRREGLVVTNAVSRAWNWKEVIKAFTPGGVLLILVKALRIWLESRQFRLARHQNVKLNVVASILHSQALTKPDQYRDVYFGSLVDHLIRLSGPTVIFGLLEQGWRSRLAKLRTSRFQLPVIPIEAYLGPVELVTCALKALKNYFFPPGFRGPTSIRGVDLSYLIKQSIRDATHSGNFCQALLMFYAAKGLAAHCQIVRCFYPYENRTWEKMLILGIRSASPESRLIGYQHASITPSHTNFLLGDAEAQVTPLPSAIVTTGPLVSKWLESNGNYPSDLIKTGCALRQGQRKQQDLKPRKPRIQNVLMALATSLEEYVNALLFLQNSIASNQSYCLKIRPHPTIPLAPALAHAPLDRSDFFSSSTGTLSDALEWADVVLYASSTVGIEAVARGIPAIYLELPDVLDTDPMFGWEGFKWSVTEPADLISALQRIEATPESAFQQLQRAGQEYVATYLSPVTEAKLASFVES